MTGYIYLYSCCIPVKGKSQSIICDLQRNSYSIIPNSLYEILEGLDKERNIERLQQEFDKESQKIFNSYLEFLVDHEYVYIDDSLNNRFSKIDLNVFDSPNLISNAIIEYGGNYSYAEFKEIVSQLDKLRCESVEIRFYNETFKNENNKVLSVFHETGIRSLKIVTNGFPTDKDFFKNLGSKFPRIREMCIYKPSTEEVHSPYFPVFILEGDNLCSKHCGFISEDHFISNMKIFTESLQYNSCLNKKISVDIEGNIKNCPSMEQSFGNIKDIKLEEVLQHLSFKKYWTLNKNEIEVCKDCEFRYICTDCRAYTEQTSSNRNGLDISKPLKCGYDPYTGEWEEWNKHPIKQKAIEYYEL
ncbi:grasp-with-spasm system SPASM domain peptide maturase [Elizabethkingia anophelis]|uniref:grasp-with-spasm system SPASM domain peptide maturase n=1 Tax=Elizabethkingia anophelis TaxID=1117645 RepID=UPI003556DE05